MQKKRGCASASEATCFINHPERNLELSSYSTFFNSLKKEDIVSVGVCAHAWLG